MALKAGRYGVRREDFKGDPSGGVLNMPEAKKIYRHVLDVSLTSGGTELGVYNIEILNTSPTVITTISDSDMRRRFGFLYSETADSAPLFFTRVGSSYWGINGDGTATKITGATVLVDSDHVQEIS